MTKILQASVDMFLDSTGRRYANRPKWVVYVDKEPSTGLWRTDGKGHYYMEKDGWVKFLFHDGEPERQQGFGGALYELEMEDGSIKSLYGPWSSNAQAVNRAGFGPCVEVVMFDTSSRYTVGLGYWAVTVPKLQELAAMVRPVDGPGGSMYGCCILDFDGYYAPAIVKGSELFGRIFTGFDIKPGSSISRLSGEQDDIVRG